MSNLATAALQSQMITALAGVAANDAPFQGVVKMTPGQAYDPQRSVGFYAMVKGELTLLLADASSITLPVALGWQTFPFAATSVSLGSGAAGTAYNLK